MNKALLSSADAKDHEGLRRALMRLFPRLASVWSNINYGADFARAWTRDRLVCSKEHFDSYFRFSVGDDVIPREEIEALIARAADREFVKQRFREALAVTRRDGKTKAMLLLTELNLHADKVADDNVGPLLTAIFALADDLDVEADEERGFNTGDNRLRIHWLLRRLTLERFDLASRSKIFRDAADKAAVSWLIDFAQSAYHDYHPANREQPEPEERCLTTEGDALALRQLSLVAIRNASKSGELAKSKRLAYLLYVWRDVAGDNGAEVQEWTATQMQDDAMIATFSRAFTSYSWSQSVGIFGLGDNVAKRNIRANVEQLDLILDKSIFRARIEELAAKTTAGDGDLAVRQFLAAWQNQESGRSDF